MSAREQVRQIVDTLPEYKIKGLLVFLKAFSEDVPNAETLEAFEELESGGGHRFSGTTDQLFVELLKEDDA